MSDEGQGVEYLTPRAEHQATVFLAESDPLWAETFAELAALIRHALADAAVDVAHVGSTSVPGLAAKPIIDILLLVTDPTDEALYVPLLEEYGFELVLREPGWHQHRLLRRVAPPTNLHVLAVGSPEAQRMLLFRDRLRSNEADRVQYERAKRALAAHTWRYVQDYADAKSAVVEEILARAETQRTSGG